MTDEEMADEDLPPSPMSIVVGLISAIHEGEPVDVAGARAQLVALADQYGAWARDDRIPGFAPMADPGFRSDGGAGRRAGRGG